MLNHLLRPLFIAAILSFGAPVAATAQSASGAYLAAQQAEFAMDFRAAADAHLAGMFHEPGNVAFQRGAVSALLALGDFDRAADIASGLVEAGYRDPASFMALLGDAVERGHYDVVADVFATPGQQLDPLTDTLVLGWAEVGHGNIDAGLAAFDGLTRQEGLATFGLFHKGLALAWLGEFEQAETVLASDVLTADPTHRYALARAQVLSELDRGPEALAYLRSVFGPTAPGELGLAMQTLEAGQPLRFSLIRTPAEGMAEMFFTLADVLRGENSDVYTLFYARVAEFLMPDEPQLRLLTADILEDLGQHDLAAEAYGNVPRSSSVHLTAALGLAETMRARDQLDRSVAFLGDLADEYPESPGVHVTLGDHLRRQKNYDDAIAAYSKGIDLAEAENAPNWYAYYVRGISYERTGQHDRAEADFRRTLELQPNHPSVLNYLGYMLVEQQQKLDEALSMIETAVAARPDNGYIVDSLGWVYFRLGRYQDAVAPMEMAAELMATDPIVNDHLGDVYWMVGREREAEFQWRRAMSFDPEPAELDRIRRKLEVGLDVVLAEEAEAADGN